MSDANEVGQKVKSALEAIEEAKRVLADFDVEELSLLSEGDYEDFEVAVFQAFLANMVRRMVGNQLQRPIGLMRISSERALELLREVEGNVGRKTSDSRRSNIRSHIRTEAFAQFKSRE